MRKKVIAILLVLTLVIGNCMVAFGAYVPKKVRKKSNDRGVSWNTYNINNDDTDGSSTGNMTNSDSQTVTASYDTDSNPICCVDIIWGELNYTYTVTQVWDPENLQYNTVREDWSPKKGNDAAKIKVVNRSNVWMDAIFSIDKIDIEGLSNVEVALLNSDNDIIAATTDGESHTRKCKLMSADQATTEAERTFEVWAEVNGTPTSTSFYREGIANVKVELQRTPPS